MQQTSTNFEIKDKKWIIETFYPLLKLLCIDDIPASPDWNVIKLLKYQDYIRKGMGFCVVCISQGTLQNTKGTLITSRKKIKVCDREFDYFFLHIVINTRICNKTTRRGRLLLRLTAIHEFTHAIAALAAISRVKSSELIDRLLKRLKEKAEHKLSDKDVHNMFRDLCKPLSNTLLSIIHGVPIKWYFGDEHYRLRFEDIRISYPYIFEELLLPNETFQIYFKEDDIDTIILSYKLNKTLFHPITKQVFSKINLYEALPMGFIERRYVSFLSDIIKDQ